SRYIGAEDVEVVRLADYLRQNFPGGVPRFGLKIDTQGFEAEVLDGTGDLIAQCDLVLAELPLQQLYGGAADLPALYTRLTGAGLRCVGLSPGFQRPISRDAIEVDGLFVRYDETSGSDIARMDFPLFTSIRLGARLASKAEGKVTSPIP